METLENLISGDKSVLVGFHTTWCTPCKMMDPIINQLDQEQQHHAHIVKVDVDQHRTLSQEFGVKSVPTFILFKKGEVVWRRSGVVDKATLMQEIAKSVG